jgi:methanogenic corrinoid protein MtbC1
MNELLEKLSLAVESGKINKMSPYPPAMKGLDGADELCQQALEAGIKPEVILNDALIPGMGRIGKNFPMERLLYPKCLLPPKLCQRL